MDWYDQLIWVALREDVEMVGMDGLVWAIKSDKSDNEDDSSDSRQIVRDDLHHKFNKKYNVHLPDSAIDFWMDYDESTNIDLSE